MKLLPGSYSVTSKDLVLGKNGQVSLAPGAQPKRIGPAKIPSTFLVSRPRSTPPPAPVAPPGAANQIWLVIQLGDVDQFVAACLKDLGQYDTALFRHPERNSIYEEAEASLTIWRDKYANQPLLEQVARYRWEGLPDDHIL